MYCGWLQASLPGPICEVVVATPLVLEGWRDKLCPRHSGVPQASPPTSSACVGTFACLLVLHLGQRGNQQPPISHFPWFRGPCGQ
jgi:hypothetical protein